MGYIKKIEGVKTIQELFSIAKDLVASHLGMDQAGLLLGVADLGVHAHGFVGAFYAPHANMIIVNKRPLQGILRQNPGLYNYYLFHVLLHEYVHSIGIYDEQETRNLVYHISKHHFGEDHVLCTLAKDIGYVMPYLKGAEVLDEPPDINIEFLHGIDKKNTNYIQ